MAGVRVARGPEPAGCAHSRSAGSGKARPRFPVISRQTDEMLTAGSRGHPSLLTGLTQAFAVRAKLTISSALFEGGIPARPLRALPTAGAVRPARPRLSLPSPPFLLYLFTTTCLFTTPTLFSFLLNFIAPQRQEILSGPFLSLQPQHVASQKQAPSH